jgi:acyl carrier protein
MVENDPARLGQLRQLVADVLELEPDEIDDDADFKEAYDVDSLRAIEILARIEKRYRVEIPQPELKNMTNFAAVCRVVARYAG